MTSEDVLIEPNQLDAGAVVPQCLDNQYVSDSTFWELIKRRTSLMDPAILALREREATTEYRRSMVYASQVVINRAFFINNPIVHSALDLAPENRENRKALVHLLKSRVIVPYLWKERSFAELPNFDLSEEGRRAIDSLLADVGAVPAVRLSKDDGRNAQLTSNLGKRFSDYVTGLKRLDDHHVNQVASELFNAVPGHERELPPTHLQGFLDRLEEAASFAFNQPRDVVVTRDALYKEFICEPGSDVADGRFRPPTRVGFELELKKLFDLRYNTNLPDALGRFTFAPVGLPGRSALCDEVSDGGRTDAATLDSLLDNARRLFMERSHKAMTLPLLGSLSLPDICEIRALESWASFMHAQESILKDPAHALDLLAQFGTAFKTFQTDLSRWYYTKYKREASEARYETAVGIVLNIAGKVLSAKYGGSGALQAAALGSVTELIPKRVKGVAAKLLVAVYDPERNRIDRDRSYSIDIWRSQEELVREQVEALVAQFGTLEGSGGVANSSAGSPP